MKCVDITDFASRLVLELVKEFKKNNYNVVIFDILKKVEITLNEIKGEENIFSV